MVENTKHNQMQYQTFKADVIAIFSADDLILMIDLGVDQLYKRKRVRLYNVLVPNAVRQAFDSDAGQLRGFVRGLITGKTVKLTVMGYAENSWTGIVEVESGGRMINVNELLISKGYGFNSQKVSP